MSWTILTCGYACFAGTRAAKACTGSITLRDRDAVYHDIANLKAALQAFQPAEVFMPAASPGTIAQVMQNSYYPTQDAYLYALADAMRYEYQETSDRRSQIAG